MSYLRVWLHVMVLCFCYVYLRLVYPMLPASLDCPFGLPLRYSITFICFVFIFLVYPMLPASLDCPFGLPLRYSLTFICIKYKNSANKNKQNKTKQNNSGKSRFSFAQIPRILYYYIRSIFQYYNYFPVIKEMSKLSRLSNTIIDNNKYLINLFFKKRLLAYCCLTSVFLFNK